VFSRLYPRELRFLREQGPRFAGAHPNTAGLLAGRSDDPDVARLEEGFAFIAAKIHERLDREMPESVRALWSSLFPHYLRSIPACSVVEFSPEIAGLRERLTVPAGYEVAALPMEGTSCRFRLAWPCDLLPLTLENASADRPTSGSSQLRLEFSASRGAIPHIAGDPGIRLFLHGEFAVTTALWLSLVRHCRAVRVRPLDGTGQEHELGPQIIRPVGFDPDHALLPWPPLALEGYRVVQEYFTMPQKFLFVDLRPLPRDSVSERFEIAFLFTRPLELPGRLSPGTFRLHCAPVINLFSASAEPIRSDLPGSEHLLRPAGVEHHHAEVYSVDSVVGLRPEGGERREHPPFHSYEHNLNPGAGGAFTWVRRELAPSGAGLDSFLSVTTPRGVTPDPSREVLSIALTCTNRALAGQVRSGDISIPASPSPASPSPASPSPVPAPFKNLLPATTPTPPPRESAQLSNLVQHLFAAPDAFQDPQALRDLLALYDFAGIAEPETSANSKRIDAILTLESLPIRRVFQGAALRGMSVLVELEEARFASQGEAVLFGSVINELLASRAVVGSFVELKIRLQPSRAEYAWPARSGAQVLE
jgi:type VI secretion system protein ImpG